MIQPKWIKTLEYYINKLISLATRRTIFFRSPWGVIYISSCTVLRIWASSKTVTDKKRERERDCEFDRSVASDRIATVRYRACLNVTSCTGNISRRRFVKAQNQRPAGIILVTACRDHSLRASRSHDPVLHRLSFAHVRSVDRHTDVTSFSTDIYPPVDRQLTRTSAR